MRNVKQESYNYKFLNYSLYQLNLNIKYQGAEKPPTFKIFLW